ncbi:hypothetical protein KO465_00385 [Candidatus Micrarchaeota archaeon]|jgi:hypothetical protein|nr:hypothetical protein [Candidatus Micrarchaeota archaeon]
MLEEISLLLGPIAFLLVVGAAVSISLLLPLAGVVLTLNFMKVINLSKNIIVGVMGIAMGIPILLMVLAIVCFVLSVLLPAI